LTATQGLSLTTAPLFPYAYYLVRSAIYALLHLSSDSLPQLGRAIVVPVAIHSALAILSAIFFFPETVIGQYRTRLRAVFTPLTTSLALHRTALATSPTAPTFATTVAAIRGSVAQSEGALVPLAATTRLMQRDVAYGRVGPADLTGLQPDARRLSVRANGMGVFFALVDPLRERFPVTPGPSRVGSPVGSPAPSRPGSRPGSPQQSAPGSPKESRAPSPTPPKRDDVESGQVTPVSPVSVTGSGLNLRDKEKVGSTARRRRQPPSRGDSNLHAHFRDIFQHHHHHGPHLHSPFNLSRLHIRSHSHGHNGGNHHHALHTSLLHFALQRNEPVVGVFESQRYRALETNHYAHPDAERFLAQAVELLQRSCDGLLEANITGVRGVEKWLDGVRQDRWDWVFVWMRGRERERCWREGREEVEKVHAALVEALKVFKEEKRSVIVASVAVAIADDLTRHAVLDPYRAVLDPKFAGEDVDTPPHRYLFHCYVYQYHLMRFSQDLIDVVSSRSCRQRTSSLTHRAIPAGRHSES
jgi:hypothetical protein